MFEAADRPENAPPRTEKDRRIRVGQIDRGDEDRSSGEAASRELPDQPFAARLQTILGARFIGPNRLEQVLHTRFDEATTAGAHELLEQAWTTLFDTDEIRPHVEHNRVKTLQGAFADYALVYRTPVLPAQPGASSVTPCTIESLQRHFDGFFLGTARRTLWYSQLDFYRQPIAEGHWALADRHYLNCTFKKPSMRLLAYARANDLPTHLVRQKSAVEEVYDRVILETALRERFFPNYNALTRTAYRIPGDSSSKQVYIYYKDNYIRISGKRGIPHWRPAKPRWPGVSPTAIFAPESR